MLRVEDYQRISSVLGSVLNSVGIGTSNACIFFAAAGAFILNKKYGLPARMAIGSAFYKIDDVTGFTVAYSHIADKFISSDEGAFHAWVEVGEYIIDFSACYLNSSLEAQNQPFNYPVNMFQKKIGEMAISPFDLQNVGDFYFKKNEQLCSDVFKQWALSDVNGKITMAAYDWFSRPPAKQKTVADFTGIKEFLQFEEVKIIGAW